MILNKDLSVYLSEKIEATDTYLPLSNSDLATFISAVPDGESIYMVLSWDISRENVLVTNTGGVLSMERGIDSTAAAFPKGSCVYFDVTVPVVKYLVCNYECCSEECEVDPVASAGAVLPAATVNNAWEGTFVFSGDLPMVFGITGMPDWMEATYSGNYVKLSGTPTATGSYTIAVSASNDKGNNIAIQQGTVTIS